MTKKTAASIQRDHRVLRHSILGAFWGWLGTLAIFMIVAPFLWGEFFSEDHHWFSLQAWPFWYIVIGIGSFLATFLGWLCFGFPIAALINDHQARSFKFMLPIHAIATELAIASAYLMTWLFGPGNSSGNFHVLHFLFNPFSIAAATIGLIGGAVFCALERRSKSWQR